MEYPDSSQPENPFVPPAMNTDTQPVLVPKGTSWPLVLGIIAIVLASLGLLGGCMSVFSTLVMSRLMSDFAQQMDNSAAVSFQIMDATKMSLVGITILGMVLAAWLLSIGIGMTRRRSWAPRLTTSWAITKMLLVVSETFMTVKIQQVQFQSMAQQAPVGPANMQGVMAAASYLGMGIGIVWGWALPVFLLIWFQRSVIRAEVATWSNEQQDGRDAGMDAAATDSA